MTSASFRTIGDLSQLLATRSQNVMLKERLYRLTNELSTGQVSDLSRHLGRDTSRLAELDRSLSLSGAHRRSALSAGGMLATMQQALDGLQDLQSDLANQTSGIPLGGTTADVANAGTAARDGFSRIVQVLNTSYGGTTLFAGIATDGRAVAASETMLAALQAAASGVTDAAGLQAAVDAWFDTPGGGFEVAGYVGDSGPGRITRPIDAGESVAIEARADDPAFRDVMKAVALVALAADPTLGLDLSARKDAMGAASQRLYSTPSGILAIQSALGLAENRVEDAVVRHGGRAVTLGILRNEMVGADPYETASQLQEVETLLQTHYTVTARLSNLSLAKYLR
ncbi:flagellin [Wenxinia saemankumensis]|uniref:Flagellar hook-associated protein 3 FlgL n=1 Tax=Wenxinia saemankumensis TaxID=1447782 RepID=A0A1M6FQQ1_9RHOB|nr:flagellin [Wenxinia saemankumensis]SHJ00027.1 flagellar hook-associated protein 3 FlgL [Wenxinia saemankumensis]